MRSVRKNEVLKRIFFTSTALLCGVMVCGNSITVQAMNPNNREQNERWKELVLQGYDWQVASDQVDEEMNHVDGAYGTGGIDGLLLNGQPAGSSSSSGSSSGGSSTPKHQHSWTETITIPPSCTEEGEKELSCSCGETKTEKIDITDHEYERTAINEGDCQTLPSYTWTCPMCGDTYDETFGVYGNHIYIPADDSVAASCTEKGSIRYVCNICQDEYTEEVEPLGHDFPDEYTTLKKADCTEDGYKAIVCRAEGCNVEKEGTGVAIPAKGHTPNPVHEIKKATFWKTGTEDITCLDCGEPMETLIIPDKGGIFKYVIPVGVVVVVLVVVSVILVFAKKRKNK